jgi:hypothetical protein
MTLDNDFTFLGLSFSMYKVEMIISLLQACPEDWAHRGKAQHSDGHSTHEVLAVESTGFCLHVLLMLGSVLLWIINGRSKVPLRNRGCRDGLGPCFGPKLIFFFFS